MLFSKKERYFIYKSALKRIINEDDSFMCNAICMALSKKEKGFSLVSVYGLEGDSSFDELNLFHPTPGRVVFGGWYDITDKDSRLNVLLFCIEMCKE
jgi:hypothetical protein